MIKSLRFSISFIGICISFAYAASVKGIISDSTSETAIEGVLVQLRVGYQTRATDTTDYTGTFQFEDIDSGSYTIRASMSGYTQKSVTATVSGPDPVTINIPLVKIVTTTISGKIIDSTSGEALSGAAVRLGSGGSASYDTTGTDGTFSFENVPTGNHSLRASLSGYVTKTITQSITGSDQITLDITLVKTVTTSISGKITDSTSGAVLAGAIVRIGYANSLSDTTGSDGSYSISNVTAGNQTLRVSMNGYTSKNVNATVNSADPLTIDISLNKVITTTLSGVVTDSITGNKLAGAIVRLGSGMANRTDTTDSNGLYSFENVSTGTQMIRVTLSNYSQKYITATISNDEPVTLNIVLTLRSSTVSAELMKKGTPQFSVTDGFIKLNNIYSPGKLSIYGLNGKLLYQYSLKDDMNKIALPEQIRITKSTFIVTMSSEGKTLTRTIIPIKK